MARASPLSAVIHAAVRLVNRPQNVVADRTTFACGAGYCRLAPLFLSNTASIGPSDTMLPWRLSDGAYKFEALPPSRNRALGQFSPLSGLAKT